MSRKFKVGDRVDIIASDGYVGGLAYGKGTIKKVGGHYSSILHDTYDTGSTYQFNNKCLKLIIKENIVGGELL